MKKQYENPQVTLDKLEISENIAELSIIGDEEVPGEGLEW